MLFILYIVFAEKPLSSIISHAVYNNTRNIFTGVFLLFVLLMEMAGIKVKLTCIGNEVRQSNPGKAGKSLSSNFSLLIWIFHTVIGVILVMNFLVLISGKDISEDMPVWGILILFIAVIREIIILVLLMSSEIPGKIKKVHWITEPLADLCLFLFTCTAYTSTWGVLGRNMKVRGENPGITIVYFIVAMLVFILFYVPINLMYYVEQSHYRTSTLESMLFYASILFTAFCAVFLLL
jgi:hypothetical protein